MRRRIVTVLAAAPMLLLFLGTGVAHAAPSSLGACAGDLTGSTFTLSGNCDSTAQILVPNTITTVNGAGFTITAHDVTPGSFIGGVLTSTPGATMNVENLKIQGAGFTSNGCARGTLFGIHFDDASGSVTNVTIDGITEDSGCNPTTGIGIRADGVTAPRTVTITKTTVTNYQRNGMDARGFMTMNISGSTVRPKDLSGVIGQNGVVFVARSGGQPDGSVSGSTIFGIGDIALEPTPENALQPAIVLAGAKNVTITNNTLTSVANFPFGPDQGVLVSDSNQDGTGTPSRGIVISHNNITRDHPDGDDPNGFGVWVFADSQATLICNTFSNWRINVVGALQIGCTLPNGAECTPYSAHTTIEGGTAPFAWSVASGTLPPGLTLATDGAITGTPTKRGTYTFTVQVTSANELTASQDESITIAPGCATPVTAAGSTVPGTTAAAVTTSTGQLPRTGGTTTMPILGIALLAAGSMLTGIARRRYNRRM